MLCLVEITMCSVYHILAEPMNYESDIRELTGAVNAVADFNWVFFGEI